MGKSCSTVLKARSLALTSQQCRVRDRGSGHGYLRGSPRVSSDMLLILLYVRSPTGEARFGSRT